MKILHLNNIANVAYEISRAQRALGYQSDVLHFRDNSFGYQYDYIYNLEQYSRPVYLTLRLLHQLKFLDYDIFHLHSSFFLPFYLDPILLRPLGKGVFFHFHGSDVRLKGKEPFFARFADACWASNPDMLKLFSCPVTLMPLPIGVADYQKYDKGSENKDRPVVLHSASQPSVSGSDLVVRAVENLQRKGINFEFVHLHKASRQDYIEALVRADIVVDKILPTTGTYAMMALEAMSLKKTVCVNLTSETLEFMPGSNHPMVAVDQDNLEEKLAELIGDGEKRRRLGEQGYEYVLRYHDARIVAAEMLKMYQMPKEELAAVGKVLPTYL
jgi:glycosyltransferase involved in cell wall biosynthesis